MESLPFHLLEEIFFKLDPKSLAMMQCIEKSINSHISDDPYFISEYLSRIGSGLLHISTFGSNIILFCNPLGDSRIFRNNDTLDTKYHLIGSCSGLLLLFVDSLCVMNPITKMFRSLDHSKSNLLSGIIRGATRWDSRFKLQWWKTYCIGFAVDQIDRTTQRFKIVCIIELNALNPDETTYQFETSTGDSCWKLSETTITCCSSNLVLGQKPVYFDGDLHWLRNDGSVVTFNPETEKARLIQIKYPQEVSLKTYKLFTVVHGLTLVSVREEVIYVYAMENILTDPKWVLVKRIWNGVLDKERMKYWNVEAYDGKCLVVRGMKMESYDGVVYSYDLSANKWRVMGSIPGSCDSSRDFYQFKPSFSSAIELNEKVDVGKISSISKIMRLIDGSSPYVQSMVKKKETRLGKRSMIEDETKLIMMEEPSSKCMDVENINKRRRIK
ncbi:putative F-box protein [Cardamine amara subsp. amara]|uniref:F-box protein n=1 Tax=Cardamine amara subsp. amara TaxID=228776 RepID=A0ABD0ZE06_CARAN